jgi:PIN domain nuclease of toxin-antitoxin system
MDISHRHDPFDRIIVAQAFAPPWPGGSSTEKMSSGIEETRR